MQLKTDNISKPISTHGEHGVDTEEKQTKTDRVTGQRGETNMDRQGNKTKRRNKYGQTEQQDKEEKQTRTNRVTGQRGEANMEDRATRQRREMNMDRQGNRGKRVPLIDLRTPVNIQIYN